MRLSMYLLLAGLLTGVSLETVRADDQHRGNCPPPEAGSAPVEHDGGGPSSFDHRERGPRARFHVQMALAEFDLDKDGRVSREEIDRALRARFNEADADHDGRLNAEEFAHARPMIAPPFGGPPPFAGRMHDHCRQGPGPHDQAQAEDRQRPPLDPKAAFNHFDWNLDGELSFEEFAAPVRQMALHLDRNGDGVIDADELRGPGMFFGPPPKQPPEPPRDR